MKALALALMMVNHLVAPLVSPWLAIISGEVTRHFLIAVFCNPLRFRPAGYWRHARKLSLALGATVAAVALIQHFHTFPIPALVQMPIAWLALLWVRPAIFNHSGKSAVFGFFLWGIGITIFLRDPGNPALGSWLSGFNLFAAGMVFPFVKNLLPEKTLFPISFLAITAYLTGSLVSIILGAKTQLDPAWVGLPLLILATRIPARLPFPVLPPLMVRHSLTVYVASLAVFVFFDNLTRKDCPSNVAPSQSGSYQSKSFKPSTRENSPVLLVTKVKPRARA